MSKAMETATFIMVALQAAGTFSAILYGVVRMERRFTRLEVNMDWIKKQCPKCNEK
jgi:hypothetical protein